jgi:FkbM family methyltransferase
MRSKKTLPEGMVRGTYPIRDSDKALIKSFRRFGVRGTPGFATDFLGIKTRIAYFTHMDSFDGKVLKPPLPGDAHYGGLEWAGTLRAVREARGELTVVELGAGWGPWLVVAAHAGKKCGIKKFNLVGLEGSRGHFEYMLTHFKDNGLDPAAHTLIHGIAAATDGVAEFPVFDYPRADWGAAALVAPGDTTHHARTETLRAYSLPTLLESLRYVDLVHIDIQGHEVDVVASAREVLKQKVRRLVIGTHSRTIEQQLFDDLGSSGWVLEAEEPTLIRQIDGNVRLEADGCQVWVNPGLVKGNA